MVENQSKKIEQSFKECNEEKCFYADILKGTCDEVVQKVSEKVASLPVDIAQKDKEKQGPSAKAAQDISVMFDDFLDKEKRKMNLVVHNLDEPEGDTFQERSAEDAALFSSMVKEAFKLSVTPV